MILITGATGGLGRNLVKNLAADGSKIRVYVRNAAKAQQMLRGNIEIIEGNLSDEKALKKAMAGINLVYHCAANVSYTAPYQILKRDNVEGTKNVLEAAAGRKVVHVSTVAVYGKNAKSPVTEDNPYSPTDLYAKSKAEADRLAIREGAIVVRPTYIYGAAVSQLGMFGLLKLIEKEKMPIVGRGWNRLHFTHVSDVVHGLIKAGERGKEGEAYNIAGPEYVSQEEFLALLAKFLKVNPPKLHVPVIVAKAYAKLLGKEYADGSTVIFSDRTFDITKAQKELGYKPKIRYAVGLKEVVAAYQARKGQQ